ncbi:MAG: HNH endonuclease [Chitinophagaceae bacterium]
MKISQTYIQYGVPSDWAEHYGKIGLALSTFRATSNKNLADKYHISADQIDFVKGCITRIPIEEGTVQQLLENSNFVCCLCKGTKSSAYIIHHIIEYSKTQDNRYANLAVLCPNDHDLAHREGLSLTHKIYGEQIKAAKKSWEKMVKEARKKAATPKTAALHAKNWKHFHPYKELRSYTEGDKEYFFGREEECQALLEKINRYTIIGLFGESGTGKTSLINAGLLPKLKSDGFISVSVRSIDEPIKRIRDESLKQMRQKINGPELDELLSTDSFAHFIIQLKKIIEHHDCKIIIIIDQFEELFTRASQTEQKNLARGIIESISAPALTGKLFFLLSLREDYLGELWDWSHVNQLEDAWIHQYRISRFTDAKARDVITGPLIQMGIRFDENFIGHILLALRQTGDGSIYPPYLQILCSVLLDKYRKLNTDPKPLILYNDKLMEEESSVESVIADYLSESMMDGLTDMEQTAAKQVLDVLTGPKGLRAFLSLAEISKYISYPENDTQHVIEHLIKRKIVHALVEQDTIVGYELVHDFLSRKFFDQLTNDEKKSKTIRDIFRRGFREWKQHEVLASKDRLDMLLPAAQSNALNPDVDEWLFLIKSSFSVYWHFQNSWPALVENSLLISICMDLLKDQDDRIAEGAVYTLGKMKSTQFTRIFREMLTDTGTHDPVKDAILHQFGYYIQDVSMLDTLKNIIQHERNGKLRKVAVQSLGQTVANAAKDDIAILETEITILYDALNDSMTTVRKQAADIFTYYIVREQSVTPLITRLEIETSIGSRKALVTALGALLRRKFSVGVVLPVLEGIAANDQEDYRVKQEAGDQIKDYRQLLKRETPGID